ncbi:hypothetical protein THAOC_09425, partial [Thalassiosira oceanica]
SIWTIVISLLVC